MKLAIRIKEVEPGKIRASCPSLPGCMVYAKSEQEAKDKIEHVIRGYLASLNAILPDEPSKHAMYV